MTSSYQQSGVNIDAGINAVERIQQKVRSTFSPAVFSNPTGFGPFFTLQGYTEPILLSSTDGVGTKLKLAFILDKHDTIGIDLVAMCVNDILRSGAQPLFFLDYIATGVLEPDTIEKVVSGIVEGCKQASCALLGGEMAEMPDMYAQGEYDVAGFVVGACEKNRLLDGSTIQDGDIIFGLPSSGIHSNGYSLVRSVFGLREATSTSRKKLEQHIPELSKTLGEELLTPTKIYAKEVAQALQQLDLHGCAHITGGGLQEKILPVIPETLAITIDTKSWQHLPIFFLIQQLGNVSTEEMYRVFNMSIGFIFIIPPHQLTLASSLFPEGKAIGQLHKATGPERVFLLS